jgi:hypothetical protein
MCKVYDDIRRGVGNTSEIGIDELEVSGKLENGAGLFGWSLWCGHVIFLYMQTGLTSLLFWLC